MQTSFGNAVDIGARTDALAKNLVSHKIFLAKLMKESGFVLRQAPHKKAVSSPMASLRLSFYADRR